MLNFITVLAASKYSTSTSNGLSVMEQSPLPPKVLPTGAPHGDLPDGVASRWKDDAHKPVPLNTYRWLDVAAQQFIPSELAS